MVASASEFRKNSFNDQDSATLAKIAALYQNVADGAVSASDSASFIISQMKAFGIEAENSIDIINAVNAVSNNFAVSSTDISSALTKTSSAMSVLGNDFQSTIGLVTAGAEIMTGQAGKVARGLRTIGNNFASAAKEADSIEYSVGGVTKSLDLLNEKTGDIKSTFEIFSDLKDDWDSMTNAEKQALAITYAGQTQFEVFAAVMNNFQTAIDATTTAFNSAGSAMQENEKYMDSVEAKENKLKAEFEDFSNRVLSKELVTGFLDAGTAMLDFANNDVGAAITRVTGLTAGVTGLIGIAGTLIGKISEMRAALSDAGAGNTIVSILTSPKTLLIIAGVVAAIAAVVEVVRTLKQAYDDAHPSFEQMNDDLSATQDEIKGVKDQIEGYRQKLLELNDVDISERGQDWINERTELETNKQVAEAYLEVLRQIEAAQTGAIAGAENYVTGYTGKYIGDFEGDSVGLVASGQYDLTKQQVASLNAEYATQQEAVMSIALALKDYIDGWEDLEGLSPDEITEKLTEKLNRLGVVIETNTETVEESFITMSDLADKASDGFDKLTKSEQEQANRYLTDYQSLVSGWMNNQNVLTNAQKEQLQTYIDLQVAANGYAESSNNVVDRIAQVANSMGISAAEAAQLLITTGELDSANKMATQNLVLLSNGLYAAKDKCIQLEDGTWQLKEAVDDLGNAAKDTGETIGKVLTDSLFDVNGNLTETAKTALTTNSALRDLAVAELEAQQQAATANYQNLISQISQIGSQAIISGQALAQMLAMANIGTGTYQDERDLKRTFAYKFKKSADANPAEYNRWLTNYISQTASSNYERQMEELSKKMGQIQSVGGGVSSSGGGGGSSKTKSAAEKAAEEAAAAAKQAWENQKQKELWELEQQEAAIKKQADDAKAEVDDYKNQLTAISKAQKEQTEAIKKELEAQLKVIQSQKDALESQKDALDVRADDLDRIIDYNQGYADKQIENLEAEKDAIQETIDAINEKYDKQIEALETTNKELDKEIEREKMLKSLADARAKKTLVFKNGRFTYEQDIEAVSKAQADLDKFDREQQIEKEKELIEENRKNELQYSKDEQAALDAEIERWKKYKDGWANLVSDYNYQQNALLAAQKYGLNLENQTWTQRLNNVSRFAKDYANIVTEQKQVQSQLTALQEEQARLQEIASARQEEVAARMQEQYDRINALMEQAQTRYNQYQEQLKNIQQNISDTSNKQYTDLPRVLKSVNGQAPSDAKIGDYIVTGGGIFQIIGGYPGAWQSNKITATKFADVGSAKNWLSSQGYQFQYARGTTSAHNGISLVGEQGPELRVTKSGDGILPAAITQNLWSWGKLDPDKVLGGVMHNLGNLVFNNANLSFPNIRSGSDARLFVENLKNLAYQYAFAR